MKKILSVILLILVACSGQTEISVPLASPVPFTTIQAAVNAAPNGGTVIVPAGNYPESVTVNRSMTVRCEQPLQCTAKNFNLWGSNITLEGFKLVGGLSYGVDVRQHNNIVRNVDISDVKYDFTLPSGQGATVGIVFFGHIFDQIYIHDLDQYHVDDLGFTEPHQDCFITWKNDARGGSGAYITISNVLCDMPQAGDTYISKVFASSGGSHHWTVRNLVGITPLACLFYDEAHHIDIAYSTFIGAGVDKPSGCKFLKLNANPAPHDNTITYSIFQNITATPVFYDYVTGHDNCFWQVANHKPDPGDIFANPLLLPDYHLAPESPCAGMGAFPNVSPVTPTKTPTPSRTPTKTYTPTATLTRTFTPTKTPTSFVIITDTVPPSPTRTPTATASPTFTPVCYPVYVGGKLIGNFCP